MSSTSEFIQAIPKFDYTEPAVPMNEGEFEKVIQSRRSVRVYNDDPIPEHVMRRCLELAILAPNSSNLQPWEFYWVRDPNKKKKLVQFCLNQPAAATAQELIVCVARLDTWRRNRKIMLQTLAASDAKIPQAMLDYYHKIVPMACAHGPFYLFAPLKKLVMNLMALRKPMPRGPASKSDMRVWAHKSTALACENLMLSLRAFDFDSCPMEGMDATRIRKLLELPRQAEICMVVSAGKRAENGIYGEQIRFDNSLFLHEL
ncbi:NADH dehydrogenase [Planctomycetes bacterium CA13]|uniref:NADH dehydrogenase n=1 Tax=Novipirellula herctigrandis TaxID=2527986 RepID=A0A5C5Z2W4_9BACT|nr:NADH dehydrogenase [Planctomycetes bacterium CA13]